jgi:TetR/AcrR family transcriptional repressor of nem operon
MVRPREFDEQQALVAAMNVFWEKGYEATSMSDLTSRMGIQRPSLYAAFGDKKALFEAAINKYSQFSFTYIQNRIQSASTVREAVRVYLKGIVDGANGTEPYLGCFCVNTMVELAPHDPSFAKFTRDYQVRLAELFQQTLEGGICSGELSRDMNAAAVARALIVSAIGLSVTMKSQPDRTFVDQAIAEILTLLD